MAKNIKKRWNLLAFYGKDFRNNKNMHRNFEQVKNLFGTWTEGRYWGVQLTLPTPLPLAPSLPSTGPPLYLQKVTQTLLHPPGTLEKGQPTII